MANEEQVERLKASSTDGNGCVTWNQWRQADGRQIEIDLTGAGLRNTDLSYASLNNANLVGAYLGYADFRYADLSYADLRDVRLYGADLSDADLTGANLGGANLIRASLKSANFTDADLSNADLRRSDLSGASLIRANLGYAFVAETHFANIELSTVRGLDKLSHMGPSHLAISTLYMSRGQIPDSFLRGCGVPDEMISYNHSIAGSIQYYSAFISYNHEDDAFATRLYNDLQANNVRCWKYTEDVKIGHDILTRVDEAIRLHEKLIVIFSEHSVQSDWVAAEVEAALAREQREGKEILFPVTIDDAVKHTHFGWAATIRRHRNIGDFTAWKDQDQYQPMFDHILRDLKSDER